MFWKRCSRADCRRDVELSVITPLRAQFSASEISASPSSWLLLVLIHLPQTTSPEKISIALLKCIHGHAPVCEGISIWRATLPCKHLRPCVWKEATFINPYHLCHLSFGVDLLWYRVKFKSMIPLYLFFSFLFSFASHKLKPMLIKECIVPGNTLLSVYHQTCCSISL